MGEILAMSHRPSAVLAILALAGLLAGCGSDTTRLETGRQASGELRNVVKGLLGKKQAAAPASPEMIAQAGLSANAGPSILATLEASKSTAFFALRGENGAMRTWLAPSEQGLITRNGLLVGTRGFGNDMMSADVSALSGLVHGARAGQAQIELRYLDGLGKERPLPLSCTTEPGGPKSETFAGIRYSGTALRAHCEGHGFAFDADYIVAGSGQIVASRQWIGPQLGYVGIRVLHP